MKVKDLIKELEKLNEEKEIVFRVSDEEEEGELEIVDKKKVVKLIIWQIEKKVVILCKLKIKSYEKSI